MFVMFQGAYAALFGSLTMTLWVGLGAILVYPPNNPKKPFSTELCYNSTDNMTMLNDTTTGFTLLNTTTTLDTTTAMLEER